MIDLSNNPTPTEATLEGLPAGLSVLHLLHRAGQVADELFSAGMGDSDLTPRQFEVLRTVSINKEPSQTTLVEQTGIDRSTLADIVRRLTERGLLARRRTRRDARMYAIQLTDAGEKALRKAAPVITETNARLLEVLSKREREALVKALQRVIDTYQQPPEPPKRKINR
ncbi:MAG: MarR family winged helix-turn-helix transcriptional regulator [Hyphomicrobiaceae bacterium]|nr:MarR family winged helix-turn-helix transcriptional regulator [Hyphomicrobiaceae bacterium]